MKFAVAIDIGGTNTRVALVDETYSIVSRAQFSTYINSPDNTLDKISEIISSFKENIIGVGMSCPGPLDLIHEKILTPPNLFGKWHNYDVSKELSKRINLPVYLENDANIAALAESVIGEGKNYRFVYYITVSTGLGSGYIIDKKIYHGAHGYANEIANSCMIHNGPSHGTIFPGGIEAISSGTGIISRAIKEGLDVVHAGQVNDLANIGNIEAEKIMFEAKIYLANLIGIIQGCLDPDIVILGGSVALKIDGFVNEIEKLVKQQVYDVIKPMVKVKKSILNENNGLLGAACLVFQKNIK